MSVELTFYRDLLGDIKVRVRQAQQKAALSANLEMLLIYWDIGRMIAARQKLEGWGAGVFPRLAADLKNELPEEKGFSLRNLKLMVQFHQEYPDVFPIGQPAVAQLGAPPVPQLADAGLVWKIGQQTAARLPWFRIVGKISEPIDKPRSAGWLAAVPVLRAKGPHLTQPRATPWVLRRKPLRAESPAQPRADGPRLQSSISRDADTQGVALGRDGSRRWRWEGGRP